VGGAQEKPGEDLEKSVGGGKGKGGKGRKEGEGGESMESHIKWRRDDSANTANSRQWGALGLFV